MPTKWLTALKGLLVKQHFYAVVWFFWTIGIATITLGTANLAINGTLAKEIPSLIDIREVLMQVVLQNQSSKISQAELVYAREAMQVQIDRDFGPTYHLGAQVVLHSPKVGMPTIYLFDNATIPDALGYHDDNAVAPEGFVFVDTALANGVPWQTVLSHELLELLADPWIDLVADTVLLGQEAIVPYEVCDPVEGDSYLINHVPVSNFVLPTWFLPQPLPGTPHTDFLRRLTAPLTVSAGGYFSYATALGTWNQVFGDKVPEWKKQQNPYRRPQRRIHSIALPRKAS